MVELQNFKKNYKHLEEIYKKFTRNVYKKNYRNNY